MRMHRGSSNDVRASPGATESLPLSASPGRIRVVLEVTRGGSVDRHEVDVPIGSPVRTALRQIGRAAEGCAVLLDGTPIPLDTPLEEPLRLIVVPTFSGG